VIVLDRVFLPSRYHRVDEVVGRRAASKTVREPFHVGQIVSNHVDVCVVPPRTLLQLPRLANDTTNLVTPL
jgi:hypothetical protein